jgi:[acyl-carrier-protein] S-malonyltransferase
MKRIAYLFPGQGSQCVGMGEDFFRSFSMARQTWEEASEIVKERLTEVAFRGPMETLTQTRYSQLALFVHSMAILRTLEEQLPTIRPTVCAGLSLGEYTALSATQRLGMQETLLLVKQRAEAMHAACEKREGAMAAVLGLSFAELEEALRGLTGVWIANYNSPGQTVISGTKAGVEKAAMRLKECGAKRILPLAVHGAFHSGLMRSAQEALAPYIAAAPIQESSIGFVMNVPGDFVHSIVALKEALTAQVTQPVRWEMGIRAMAQRGVDLYLEMGSGKTLTGLNRKMELTAPTLCIEKVGDLDLLAQTIEKGIPCNC